uniref:Centromere protein J-like n=1 Tax=Saccoglossus kowalevskii TaxID=10224 RepID=A0ABM0M2X3_SACKO|nr:PREDICTED: centromere protein J-like [Saccoglossus kowalevskii]
MESEDTGQDNLSRMPVATSCIPSGFITSSSRWTSNSRAGVVLDFNPPTLSTMPTKDLSHVHTNSGQEVNLLPKQVDINSKHEPLSMDVNIETHTDYDASDNFQGALPQFFNKEFQEKIASPKLDTSIDVLEHQASKEQAKLLQRFKQLKQWQQEQQDKLLRQQKDQLEQFKNEQERVKSMIALQRQIQWGGSSSSQSSHKPTQLSSQNPSTIPHILANAASGGAKGLFPPVQDDVLHQYPAQPTFPSSSLPVEDDQEESEFDSASDIQSSTVMEGVEPLPDTASEFSDMPSEDKHTKEQTQVTMAISSDSERNLNKYSSWLEPQTLDNNLELDKGPDFWVDKGPDFWVDEGSDFWVDEGPDFWVDKRPDFWGDKGPDFWVDKGPDFWVDKGPDFWVGKGPDFWVDKGSDFWVDKGPDFWVDKDADFWGDNGSDFWVDKGPDFWKLEVNKEAKDQIEFDELPVSAVSAGGRIKTFEELLEEQLQLESQSKDIKSVDTQSKKPFLRKGQGIGRFGLAGKKSKISSQNLSTAKVQDAVVKQDTAEKKSTAKFDHDLHKKGNGSTDQPTSLPKKMKDSQSTSPKVEQEELKEFELLEQAADDTSFTSNSSMVARMLNKQKKWTPPTIHERDDREDLRKTGNDDRGSSTEEENDYDENDRTLEPENSPSAKQSSSHELSVDFNDDESWGDFSHDLKDSEEEDEEEEDSYHDNGKQEESIIAGSENLVTSTPPLRKLASSAFTKETLKDSGSTPPTSGLMTKLFPQLKPVESKESQHIHQQTQKLQHVNERVYNDGIQSKVLKEKLAELETEIERFRRENANLLKLRDERDKAMKQLQKEMRDFDKLKTEELQQLEEFKDEEMKKLRREKKTFEKYQKAARAVPDKKEREEIETLKKQLLEVQDEMRRKETRWNSSSVRLHTRIENLEKDNHELRDELQILERRRLDSWKRDEEAKSKEKKLHKRSRSREKAPSQDQTKNQETPNHDRLHEHIDEPTSPLRHKMKSPIRQKMGDKPNKNTTKQNEREYEVDDLLPEDTPRKQLLINSLTKQSSEVDGFQGYTSESNPPRRPVHRKRAIKFDSNDSNYELKVSTQTIDNDSDMEEISHPDGKVECRYPNGRRVITFTNGTRKEISPDGLTIIVSFFNGDIKQIMPDQRVIYYYSEAKTTHTTYCDGLEVLQFPNNQIEKHYPDGTKEITFPDHTIKYLFPNGCEESIFPDGTVLRVDKNSEKTMEFPNGQREIHTAQYKKREYPDGTVKTVYPDGRQETRYSNGRIRVKDKDGRIIVDRLC